MKTFHKELDRETWELIQALTVESDKRVTEAVQELKTLKANSNE